MTISRIHYDQYTKMGQRLKPGIFNSIPQDGVFKFSKKTLSVDPGNQGLFVGTGQLHAALSQSYIQGYVLTPLEDFEGIVKTSMSKNTFTSEDLGLVVLVDKKEYVVSHQQKYFIDEPTVPFVTDKKTVKSHESESSLGWKRSQYTEEMKRIEQHNGEAIFTEYNNQVDAPMYFAYINVKKAIKAIYIGTQQEYEQLKTKLADLTSMPSVTRGDQMALF